jgi:hypothetical protein
MRVSGSITLRMKRIQEPPEVRNEGPREHISEEYSLWVPADRNDGFIEPNSEKWGFRGVHRDERGKRVHGRQSERNQVFTRGSRWGKKKNESSRGLRNEVAGNGELSREE